MMMWVVTAGAVAAAIVVLFFREKQSHKHSCAVMHATCEKNLIFKKMLLSQIL